LPAPLVSIVTLYDEMSTALSLKTSGNQNHKAQLANAYNELGKELSSTKIRVIGNYTLGKVIGEGTVILQFLHAVMKPYPFQAHMARSG
jgi:hypothetical protein